MPLVWQPWHRTRFWRSMVLYLVFGHTTNVNKNPCQNLQWMNWVWSVCNYDRYVHLNNSQYEFPYVFVITDCQPRRCESPTGLGRLSTCPQQHRERLLLVSKSTGKGLHALSHIHTSWWSGIYSEWWWQNRDSWELLGHWYMLRWYVSGEEVHQIPVSVSVLQGHTMWLVTHDANYLILSSRGRPTWSW